MSLSACKLQIFNYNLIEFEFVTINKKQEARRTMTMAPASGIGIARQWTFTKNKKREMRMYVRVRGACVSRVISTHHSHAHIALYHSVALEAGLLLAA